MQVDNVQLLVLIIIMILGQLAGFVIGFLQNRNGSLFDVLGWSFPVAKGAARAIQASFTSTAIELFTFKAESILFHQTLKIKAGSHLQPLAPLAVISDRNLTIA